MTDRRSCLSLGLRLSCAGLAVAIPLDMAVAQGASASGWLAMLDACSGYAETGEVAAFDGWRPAETDPSGCTTLDGCGVASLELSRGDVSAEQAALSLAVGAADLIGSVPGQFEPNADFSIDDAPQHFHCKGGRAFSTPFEALAAATEEWVAAAVTEGELVVLGRGETGTVVMQGCGYDGRPYSLSVVTFPGMFPQLSTVYPAQPQTEGLDPAFCEGAQ